MEAVKAQMLKDFSTLYEGNGGKETLQEALTNIQYVAVENLDQLQELKKQRSAKTEELPTNTVEPTTVTNAFPQPNFQLG